MSHSRILKYLLLSCLVGASVLIAACGSSDDTVLRLDVGFIDLAGGLHAGHDGHAQVRDAHHRHRQAGLPAVLRGQRPDQRQGLRERDRLRDRRPARLQPGRRSSGRSSRSTPPTRPGRRTSTSTSTRSRSPRSGPSRSTSPRRTTRPTRRSSRSRTPTPPARPRSPTCRTPRSASRSARPASTRSTDEIQPSSQPQVFNNSNDVVTALKKGQVDAVVVDLPTALYLTAAQVPDATIVGQFPAPGGDQWGALLAKDSPLTGCVSAAIDELAELGRARQDRGAVDEQRRRTSPKLQ